MSAWYIAIYVLLHSGKEATWIIPTLEAVSGWSHEILLIDNESEDDTVETALRYGDRGLTMPRSLNVDAAQSIGLDEGPRDWIWMVDAEEVPLARSIGAA